jgi:mono/diheme cytochrome c family protein
MTLPRRLRHDPAVMLLLLCFALGSFIHQISAAPSVAKKKPDTTTKPPAIPKAPTKPKTDSKSRPTPSATTAVATEQDNAKKIFKSKITPFVTKYCLECHGQRRMKGGFNLYPALKNPGTGSNLSQWKKALANIVAHDMPPDDADNQPTDQERDDFVDAVATIKYLSNKDPGPFVMRRLTKVEYGNTLHDLFGVDPKIANELPDEVFGEGYLNTVSPLQMEQYLGITNEVLNRVLAPSGKPATDLQNQLFGHTPAPDTDTRTAARNIARTLARRAYRRPASEIELDVLLKVFDLANQNQLSYPEALRLMLKAILVSPQFLFITPVPSVQTDQAILPLDDFQLASRLSYLLWATMPDAELATLADQGKLHDPTILNAQVQRLLKDSRSRALFDGFGAQWLGIDGIQSKTFDTAKFPQMTGKLRTAMYDEAAFSLTASCATTAAWYHLRQQRLHLPQRHPRRHLRHGKAQVTGAQMRKVQLNDSNRGGILAMPGILATTSFPNRTSAVKRGVWVLEQVLGEQVPPAPPNVPALEKQDKKKVANLTLRQRTELHRTNAVCQLPQDPRPHRLRPGELRRHRTLA